MDQGNYYSILGFYQDSGKEHENYSRFYRGCIGIMAKKMETTIRNDIEELRGLACFQLRGLGAWG